MRERLLGRRSSIKLLLNNSSLKPITIKAAAEGSGAAVVNLRADVV